MAMADKRDVARSGEVRGVEVTGFQSKIVDHRQQAARRVAGAEEAVDVLVFQTRVGQRPGDAFRVKAPDRKVGRLARRVLESARDIG